MSVQKKPVASRTREAIRHALTAGGDLVADALDGVGDLRISDTLITTAQVLALNATPIEVVAAPGAGIYNEFVGAVLLLDYNSAAYAGVAAGEDLVFKYTDASGAEISAHIETTGFIDQTNDEVYFVGAKSAQGAVGGVLGVANAAIVLHLLTSEVITGDSPIKIRTIYRQISLAHLERIGS